MVREATLDQLCDLRDEARALGDRVLVDAICHAIAAYCKGDTASCASWLDYGRRHQKGVDVDEAL
jgi:hypothetical protein